MNRYNQTKFLILDDIVTTFDSDHRMRLIRLLLEEFSNYQILLLTHERNFFELFENDAKKKNWIINKLKYTDQKGTFIDSDLTNTKEKIEAKLFSKETDGLGNEMRIFLEGVCKDVANNIEAKMNFEYNNRNELRTAYELLNAIQSKTKDHSKTDLMEKLKLNHLLGSPLFVANRSSHDSSFEESIDDFKVLWQDILEYISLFECDSCRSYLSMKNYDSVNKLIRCRCGDLCFDWK